ncbi:hypothetical protein TELCIR_12805, partial [Teladorsagia circumcincta]
MNDIKEEENILNDRCDGALNEAAVYIGFFIAAFQNGNLSTMKAQYQTRDGALRVIRPLIFVRERALREFADSKRLPVIAENCPACFNQATERHRIKQ